MKKVYSLCIVAALIAVSTLPAHAVSSTAAEKANENACKEKKHAVKKEKQRCVPQTSITFSADGCTATAHAAPGTKLVFGARVGNSGGWSSEPVVIPDSGELIASTGGIKNMTSFATLQDTDNNELLTSTALITADGCDMSPEIPNGGYPAYLANAPRGSLVDPWGMYNRESTSYAAFKTYATGKYMPFGLGNANQWDDRARAAGIPVDAIPQVGDIAVSNAGFYGHVMFVEKLNQDGTIKVSHYNPTLMGEYAVSTVGRGNLVFIHFLNQ